MSGEVQVLSQPRLSAYGRCATHGYLMGKSHFVVETELRDPAMSWLRRTFPGAVAVDELQTSVGRPDLVAGVPSAGALPERAALPLVEHVALLEALRRPQPPEALRLRTSGSWARYRRDVLEPLRRAGWARETTAGWWLGDRLPQRPFELLVAVELKLTDWRTVVSQARRNKVMTDESWAVMPSASWTAAGVAAAREWGVGAVAVLDDSSCRVLVVAERATPLDWVMHRHVNELLLAALRDEQPRPRAGSRRGP